MYRISSTKIPEYLNSKVGTRSSKAEKHWMIPNWPWTFNSDMYSAGTKDFPLTLKCTEWPQTEFEHLKSQKYSIYTKYLPLGPKDWSVSLYN